MSVKTCESIKYVCAWNVEAGKVIEQIEGFLHWVWRQISFIEFTN